MSAAGEFTYSGYASQTVRTLRGLLDTTPASPTRWSIGNLGFNTLGPRSRSDTSANAGEAEGSLSSAPTNTRDASRPKRSARVPLNDLFREADSKESCESGAHFPERIDQPANQSTKTSTTSRPAPCHTMDKVLYYAGTHRDPYTSEDDACTPLPLLALCPCNLPLEMTDLMVSQLIERLDKYGRNPYMIALFASPSSPIPVQHLIRYYRGIHADTRRNVKRIWICHAGLLTRM